MEKTEQELRQAIITELTKCPGQRKRNIAWGIQVPLSKIITLLYDMCEEGILERKEYRNFAQIEYYEKYYVKGQ